MNTIGLTYNSMLTFARRQKYSAYIDALLFLSIISIIYLLKKKWIHRVRCIDFNRIDINPYMDVFLCTIETSFIDIKFSNSQHLRTNHIKNQITLYRCTRQKCYIVSIKYTCDFCNIAQMLFREAEYLPLHFNQSSLRFHVMNSIWEVVNVKKCI